MHENKEMDIENIFDKDTFIKLSILDLIYSTGLTGVNISSLVKNVGLERRTIYSSINAINDLSEIHSQKSIYFRNNKYFFSGDKLDLYKLKNSIINLSPITKLINLLLTSSRINLSRFCLDHFLVESTFKKKLKNINEFLKLFDIKLISRKNEITIAGDEIKIRYYFASFFWKTTRGTIWPFHTISKKRLETILFSSLPLSISYGKKEHLLYIIAINIIRSKTKHSVSTDFLPQYYKELIASSNLSQDIYNNILTTYYINSSEIEYIILLLYTFPEYLLVLNNNITILNIIEVFSPKTFNILNSFASFIENKHPGWEDKYDSTTFFSVVLAATISTEIFKEIPFNISSLNLFNYLNKNFPNLISNIKMVVAQTVPTCSKEIQNVLSLRLAQSYITIFPPQDFETELLIYLETDLPIYLEKIIYNQITLILCSKFNFHLTTEYTSKTPDIILTTSVSTREYPTSNVVYIEDELSPKNHEEILILCKKLSSFS